MRSSRSLLDRGWLVLTSGVVLALVFSALWLSRATAPFMPDPEPVAKGETASTPEGDFSLRGMTTVDVIPQVGDAESPMPGAAFVAVLFDYSAPPGVQVYCSIELLGDQRRWLTERSSYVKDWGYQSYCEGSSGTVLKFFEIPRTAIDEIHGIRIRGNGGTVILAGEVEPA